MAADAAQIKHVFAIGNDGMNETDILRAAKELGFKAKAADVEYERLQKLPLPAIVKIARVSIAISKEKQITRRKIPPPPFTKGGWGI